MNVQAFKNYDFFAGVPDSQLKPLCDWLMSVFGINKNHMIAANEGNAVALAAGHYLATGKVPVVYLQNSGIGNLINPVASLTHPKVYGIPMLFIVGWRGEPGVYDEPQHLFQGAVTLQLLKDMEIETFVIDKTITEEDFIVQEQKFAKLFKEGKSAAYVIKKNALSYEGKLSYQNQNELSREAAIEEIVTAAAGDIIISTTGKASRELYEIRNALGQPHEHDFLTVGSMGHSSSIALSIALQKPNHRIWVVDGDGAAIMHLGSMATIGAYAPPNLIHILINNEAHESVGGFPTISGSIDFQGIAKAVGYKCVLGAADLPGLRKALVTQTQLPCASFLEIKTALGSRPNLGRPGGLPADNKKAFMATLEKGNHSTEKSCNTDSFTDEIK